MADEHPSLVAERMRVRVLSAPLDDTVPMSFGRLERRQVCLVEIDAGGLTGIGESWVNYPAWGPVERVATLCEGVAPRLLGYDVADPGSVQDRLVRDLLPVGRQWGATGPIWQALSAVDMAVWDLRGQAAGAAVHRLLGGEGVDGADAGRPEAVAVPAYASGVGPTAVEELSRRAVELGLGAVKLKVGFGPATDVATARAARAALGPSYRLFADANQAWDLPTAADMVRRLAEFDIGWLEEPLDGDSLEDLEKLYADTSMPLATGENLYGLDTFRRYVDSPAVQIIQPDLAKAGGLTMAREVAAHAARNATSVAPHCYSSGVGVMAMLHLATAFGSVDWLEYDVRDNPLRSHLFTEPLLPTDGRLQAPDRPGLGVTLDPDALSRYQTRCEERTAHDF